MVEKADKVKWSQADNVTLVHTLTATKNKGDWGDNNPKKLVWVECTKALAGSKKKSGGIAKQPDTIRGRWSKVCLLSHTICYCTDEGTQLKLEYDIVKELWGLSGFSWDATLSTVMADPDVWTAYIKVRSGGTRIHRSITCICSQNLSASKVKLVKTFCRKPFPLFDAIGDLIDGTCTTGRGVFQVGQVSAFDNSDHDSVIHDNSPNLINSRIDLILLKASCNMKDKASKQVHPIWIQRKITDCWHCLDRKTNCHALRSRKLVNRSIWTMCPAVKRTTILVSAWAPHPHCCHQPNASAPRVPSLLWAMHQGHIVSLLVRGCLRWPILLPAWLRSLRWKGCWRPKGRWPLLQHFHKTPSWGQSLHLRQMVHSAMMRCWMWLRFLWLIILLQQYMPPFKHPERVWVWCSVTWQSCGEDWCEPVRTIGTAVIV